MAENKIKEVFSSTGKATTEKIDKAKAKIIKTLDQNDDDKFDLDDFAVLADQWKAKAAQKKHEAEINALRPIFEEDLNNTDFLMSKLIRVAEVDKKHAESEVCRDAIGFESTLKDLRVVNVYLDKAEAFGLTFYPDMDSEIYYVDPNDRDHYIALDSYFNYLKVARVSELQKIAQDLGAKHFRVVFKEQEKSTSTNNVKGKLGGKAPGKQHVDVEYSHDSGSNSFSKVEIAAEMECLGHKPVEPTLFFFKKDPQIQSLISLRMSDNPMTHQVYTLVLSNSSGIKMKDAIKIDSALKAMKFTGNISISSEVQAEAHRFFQYEIDF